MTVEWMPVGQRCNLSCTYCYENGFRRAGNFGKMYDLEKMKAAQPKDSNFTVFGGEPLLVPIEDLEEIFKFGYERYKTNSIQSNGALITDAHVELFKKYNVHAGISFDGPDELNDARTSKNTRQDSQKTLENLWKLREAGISTSLIVTIHRLNGIQPNRDKLKNFLLEANNKGITSIRLHSLENDNATDLMLTTEENIEAFLDLKSLDLKFDIFTDIRKLLTEEKAVVSCVWNACDPLTTSAVYGIDGDGTLSNCGRATGDGVSYRKSNRSGNERTRILFNTPQEHGGCKGCRFFFACKGQCPGEGIDKDWRNRSHNCEVYKALFEDEEKRLKSEGINPISLNDSLRLQLEQKALDNGPTTAYNGHGDHHVNTPHQDIYHMVVPIL